MSETHPGTHEATALALPATARAVAGHRRRAGRWAALGAAATLVGLVFAPGVDATGTGWLRALAGFCVVCGPAATVVGAAALVTSRRMRRAVARHAWRACSAVAIPAAGQGPPRVVLRHPATDALIPLSVRTMAPRYHLADPGPGGVLWWAGDPAAGGVIAPPGGEHLLWVRPTPSGRLRRRDAEAALRRGLLSGPVPPQPSAGPPPGQPDPDPTYAVLARAAHRLCLPGTGESTGRQGPDARAVPWWRVRVLLEISQVRPAAVSAAFAVGVLLTWWLWGGELDSFSLPLFAAALSVFNALRFGRLALRSVPVVRALHRAARAPVSVRKRYVALPGRDDGLVLVLFPLAGGPDDLPEACVEVSPPGVPRRPWEGMPSPSGTAELHGRIDDAATVVPWIDGRPLWPRHPYEKVDLGDRRQRDRFAALVGHGRPERADGPP